MREVSTPVPREEIDHVEHVLLGAFVFEWRAALGRRRRLGPRNLIFAAVVGLPQRTVTHGRHDEIAALFRLLHEGVRLTVRVLYALAGAQGDEHWQPRAGFPSRGHEQTIRNGLGGPGNS